MSKKRKAQDGFWYARLHWMRQVQGICDDNEIAPGELLETALDQRLIHPRRLVLVHAAEPLAGLWNLELRVLYRLACESFGVDANAKRPKSREPRSIAIQRFERETSARLRSIV